VSLTATVLQIVNNVAGAGILTLSAGMAGGVGTVPATVMCLVLGVISGLTFHLIGASCELTGTTTFKALWAATLGSGTAWVVDASIALMCFSAAIIYAGILGDTSTQLLSLSSLPAAFNQRAINIGVLSAVALTPLSLLKDLSALAFTSLLGCVAVVYTAIFVAVRALDGSYALPSGRFLSALPPALTPSFARASTWNTNAQALVLTSNLGLAYIAHYNAPAFYRSLEERSEARFGRVCAYSFGVLTLLYLGMMRLGYATFGDVTRSNLLSNYAATDALATFGRAATFASILFGFPLAMMGLKDSSISLINTLIKPSKRGKPPKRSEELQAGINTLRRGLGALASTHTTVLTLGLLVAISAVAILVIDIGLVVGISGAVLGAAIVYIFPALIYAEARPGVSLLELTLVYGLVPMGLAVGILGVWMTLQG